jgi:hypothetical protein
MQMTSFSVDIENTMSISTQNRFPYDCLKSKITFFAPSIYTNDQFSVGDFFWLTVDMFIVDIESTSIHDRFPSKCFTCKKGMISFSVDIVTSKIGITSFSVDIKS